MQVYLCEKPDQAEKLARFLGIDRRRNGYFEGCGTYVTWAYGHLLELYAPDDYDESLKRWSMDSLPIIPQTWKRKVTPSKRKQFGVIKTLLKEATNVVLACDYDREGEAIACSIIDYCGYKGARTRLKLRALDQTSIQRAMNEMVDASETRPLYHAALVRQRADWLVGMNLTRLYTTLIAGAGGSGTMNIGRVLTPTVKLVCDRDTVISDFVSHPYYVVSVNVQVAAGGFTATWTPGNEDYVDDEGRCISDPVANNLVSRIENQRGKIVRAETRLSRESAPLPFDLAALQKHASTAWGMPSARTLEVAQSLYDAELLSYPRVDCRHIPESQLSDAPLILNALIKADPEFSGICNAADLNSKPRCFEDSKVTAHHAIIPTMEVAQLDALSQEQRMIYDSVRRAYVAQFYPSSEFNRTIIEVECSGESFVARGKVPIKPGWRMIFQEYHSDENVQDDPDSKDHILPAAHQGENALTRSAQVDTKATRPPPHFTESTLLGAMESIARYVDDEDLKKILNENAGIGTPATRASIIQGAIDRDLLQRNRKNLVATYKAYILTGLVAPMLSSPAMTAAWEQKFEAIVEGEADYSKTIDSIASWIEELVERIKLASPQLIANMQSDPQFSKYLLQSSDATLKPPESQCPICGGLTKRFRRKDKSGHFWKCQEISCQSFFNDCRGKLVPPVVQPAISPDCPKCGSGMTLKKRRNKKGSPGDVTFWSCNNFQTTGCKGSLPFTAEG